MRPYLVEFGKIGCETAVPLMRALVLYDQDDENCRTIWNEYMLGDAFLVAPVLDRSVKSRSIYLPKGSWTDLYTGEVYEGGHTLLSYKAPISKISVFVNNNSASATLTETLAAMRPYIDEINALSNK
jgi:alpha-D-xyloside xylohydrolase